MFQDNCFDLVFADPPFNIGYAYDEYDDKVSPEMYLAWSRIWMRRVFRVLRPGGAFWLAIGDEYAAELLVTAKTVGFELRSWCVWYYTFGVHCIRKFARSHTHLLYMVKPGKQVTWNGDPVKVPSARQRKYRDKRAAPGGRIPDNVWILDPGEVPAFSTATRSEHDVWFVPRVAGTHRERDGFHGCQMPEAVLTRILLSCTNTCDRVLDPFAGSGTTLVVSRKLGRRSVGIELSGSYCNRIRRRLERDGCKF